MTQTRRNPPLLKKPQSTLAQFIRYLFVGGFAAVIDTGSLYGLHQFLGVNYLVAAAAGFLLGLLTNYLISIAWIFETSGRFKDEFGLFTLIGLGGLAWTELILWIGVGQLGAPVMAGKFVALFLVLFWNFWMRKTFVFRAKPADSTQPLAGESSAI